MPVLRAEARSLTLRFELHEHPEHVVQELVEEVGEDAEVFPYSIRTYVEVDGEQLGVISSAEIHADATSIPRISFKVADGLTVSDLGNALASEDLRASIQNTMERLSALHFVEVSTPYTEVHEVHEPERPPGLTIWERLVADDDE